MIWAPWTTGSPPAGRSALNLEEMGFVVEASHHEVAPGQHEIDIKYGEAMDAADNIMTFKLAVKTLAQRNGPPCHLHAQAPVWQERFRDAYQYVLVQRRKEPLL